MTEFRDKFGGAAVMVAAETSRDLRDEQQRRLPAFSDVSCTST